MNRPLSWKSWQGGSATRSGIIPIKQKLNTKHTNILRSGSGLISAETEQCYIQGFAESL